VGRLGILAGIVGIAVASADVLSQSAQPATVYEGARLIVGDASAPIDNGACVAPAGTVTEPLRRAPRMLI